MTWYISRHAQQEEWVMLVSCGFTALLATTVSAINFFDLIEQGNSDQPTVQYYYE